MTGMSAANHFPDFKLCVSSTSGGGGKTLLSLGLARALSESGRRVKPYKKGPDYIDSAWLSAACGIPATNLDPFFLDAKGIKEIFAASIARSKPTFALLEGNRGLYDGLDDQGSCSTASLCRMLDFPILLTIDCAKITRTLAALIKGLVEFEENLNFVGVILNNVGSRRHELAIRSALKAAASLPVLGILPRLPENPLPERHMGLATIGETLSPRAEEIFNKLANLVKENCDLEAILSASKNTSTKIPSLAKDQKRLPARQAAKPVIAYMADEAFWFYYPENLEALEKAGAQLMRFSFLASEAPDLSACSGIYLGGGFPEDYCEKLSESPNLALLSALAKRGMPIYAECGGLLLLCENLQHKGKNWPMAGVFPLRAVWHKRPQGLGYTEGIVRGKNPFYRQGQLIRGHEFHYSSCEASNNLQFQIELCRGKGLSNGKDGVCVKNAWGSYLHIFAPALPFWAVNFVNLARAHQPHMIAATFANPSKGHEHSFPSKN